MKHFVALALLLAISTIVFGQQMARSSPPDLLARETSAPAASESTTRAAQSPQTPEFFSVAADPSPTGTDAAAMIRPVARPSEQKQVFHRKLFISELAAYTAANVLDGITTVRGVRRGFTESAWPKGSSELLGTRPGIARYSATMGALELGAAFASYRLQHSRNRYLRLVGHSFMVEGTVEHTIGFASNMTLPNRP
jgi:hypothetical protein